MRINVLVLLFAIVMIYFLYLIREDISQNKELAKEAATLSARIKTISEDNQNLAASFIKTKSDKNIERLARERLNFIKKGETAFKICR